MRALDFTLLSRVRDATLPLRVFATLFSQPSHSLLLQPNCAPPRTQESPEASHHDDSDTAQSREIGSLTQSSRPPKRLQFQPFRQTTATSSLRFFHVLDDSEVGVTTDPRRTECAFRFGRERQETPASNVQFEARSTSCATTRLPTRELARYSRQPKGRRTTGLFRRERTARKDSERSLEDGSSPFGGARCSRR
jgi:hypothetical protein